MHRHATHKRERWLNDAEIRALWAACSDMGTFGVLVRTLLASGQRLSKVAGLKWEDLTVVNPPVDATTKLPAANFPEWRIAREAREKGAAERLRLPLLVRDIIGAQPRLANNPYVFAAAVGSSLSSFGCGKANLDAEMPEGTERWTLHDLRRTARKLMTRAGVRVDVAELALGHSIKGIRAHYDDPGEYQPMIDAAVQAVANEVERILNPPGDNVVPLGARSVR
jgi:integrase